MVRNFRIDPGAYILLAMGLLMLPLDWLLAVILAAGFHELCHYAMARFLGIPCLSFRIGTAGAVMEFSPMGRWEELLVTVSGPLGSFLLVCLARIYPQIAVCGLVQGLFNLLPIWPLDGGRILRCFLGEKAEILEWITCIGLLVLGIWLGRQYGTSLFLIMAIVTGKAFLRKIPCKPTVLGVQ